MRVTFGGNRHDALFFLLFGLVFGGTAAAGWTLLLIGRRKLQQQEKLRARYPDQPWMWREEWAAGRISDSGRTAVWGSWIFSTLWNLISFPAAYLAIRAAQQAGNSKAYVALLFPLAGSGLLIWAIRNTLRLRKYGTSVLELSTLPGTIGHRLAGQVRASAVLQSVESFTVALSCINRVTSGSGKSQSNSERILWQDEQRLRGEACRDAGGCLPGFRSAFSSRQMLGLRTSRAPATRSSGVSPSPPMCREWITRLLSKSPSSGPLPAIFPQAKRISG
jgi:uncharacterized membrane protein YedE/YeeE